MNTLQTVTKTRNLLRAAAVAAFLMLSSVLAAQTLWEGNAAVGAYGILPVRGLYGASNSFPRNTVVRVENLENGKSAEVIIVDRLENSSFLIVLSQEAGSSLGIGAAGVIRIRATLGQADKPAAYALSGDRAYSPDPDQNPAASAGETDGVERENTDDILAMSRFPSPETPSGEVPALPAGETSAAEPAVIPEPETVPEPEIVEAPGPEETPGPEITQMPVPENLPEPEAEIPDAAAAEPELAEAPPVQETPPVQEAAQAAEAAAGEPKTEERVKPPVITENEDSKAADLPETITPPEVTVVETPAERTEPEEPVVQVAEAQPETPAAVTPEEVPEAVAETPPEPEVETPAVAEMEPAELTPVEYPEPEEEVLTYVSDDLTEPADLPSGEELPLRGVPEPELSLAEAPEETVEVVTIPWRKPRGEAPLAILPTQLPEEPADLTMVQPADSEVPYAEPLERYQPETVAAVRFTPLLPVVPEPEPAVAEVPAEPAAEEPAGEGETLVVDSGYRAPAARSTNIAYSDLPEAPESLSRSPETPVPVNGYVKPGAPAEAAFGPAASPEEPAALAVDTTPPQVINGYMAPGTSEALLAEADEPLPKEPGTEPAEEVTAAEGEKPAVEPPAYTGEEEFVLVPAENRPPEIVEVPEAGEGAPEYTGTPGTLPDETVAALPAEPEFREPGLEPPAVPEVVSAPEPERAETEVAQAIPFLPETPAEPPVQAVPSGEAESIQKAPSKEPAAIPYGMVASAPVVRDLEKGSHYIQVGVYADEGGAESAVNRISSWSPVPVVVWVPEAGDSRYKVMVGPLSQDESGVMLYNLKSRGYRDAFLRKVVEIN